MRRRDHVRGAYISSVKKFSQRVAALTPSLTVALIFFAVGCFSVGTNQVHLDAARLRGVPVFIFHEGGMEPAGAVFRQIAHITKGAYCSFDARSPQQLRDLLKAVAIFAAGGRKALENFGNNFAARQPCSDRRPT